MQSFEIVKCFNELNHNTSNSPKEYIHIDFSPQKNSTRQNKQKCIYIKE